MAVDYSDPRIQEQITLRHRPGKGYPIQLTMAVALVRVLEAGIYNGPEHKSLGQCEVGEIIPVVTGGYSQYLIENGFVEAYTPNVPQPEPEPEPPPAQPWMFWLVQGIEGMTDTVAQALYADGLQNKQDVITRFTREGLDGLTRVKGVGKVLSRRILAAAGEHAEVIENEG